MSRPRSNLQPLLETESPYWIYRYDRPELPGKWSRVLPENETDAVCPHPRYAHQVVYDCKSGIVYMHGGNAGSSPDEEEHLPELHPSSSDGVADTRTSPPRSPQSSRDSDVDKRLDDFWSMEIIRYAFLRQLRWENDADQVVQAK